MSTRAAHTGPREWDAEVYDRVSDPQFEWAQEVLERLPLRGDETVLDAGCGSGRVTALLLDRLPDGKVIAIDGSASMVAKAREALGNRADVREGDLAQLELHEEVDLVYSNAVFHWITDHDNLFGRLFAALRPGGRLIAQCGGAGNVASLARVIIEVAAQPRFAEHFTEMSGMWNFATAEDTETVLGGAGFEHVRCWLQPKDVQPAEPIAFLATVTLGPHLERLPDELKDPFVADVAAGMGKPLVLDYVRLNIKARKP
ncbi:MAG: methyltransferase domain-containing protein [Actinomycetota bacterium]|nr:methyltransferase domain-containing protein [Actinomycetota bacterium]